MIRTLKLGLTGIVCLVLSGVLVVLAFTEPGGPDGSTLVPATGAFIVGAFLLAVTWLQAREALGGTTAADAGRELTGEAKEQAAGEAAKEIGSNLPTDLLP